jgi:GntR family transcriptional regulator / MocR family aminotransferase
MPRRAEDREFVLPARTEQVSLQRWLYGELRGAILNGRLTPGTRLPSTRDLAQQYGVARGTVTIAYDQLAAEGYLTASVGRGTFVEQEVARKPRSRPQPTPAIIFWGEQTRVRNSPRRFWRGAGAEGISARR